MMSFIIIDTKGKVNCKLSVIDIRSPQTLIRECMQGITQTKVTIIINKNTRMLAINFSRVVSSIFGQRPMNSRLWRFSSIAHSKSSYQSVNSLIRLSRKYFYDFKDNRMACLKLKNTTLTFNINIFYHIYNIVWIINYITFSFNISYFFFYSLFFPFFSLRISKALNHILYFSYNI